MAASFEERDPGQECAQDTLSTRVWRCTKDTQVCLLFLSGELRQMLGRNENRLEIVQQPLDHWRPF